MAREKKPVHHVQMTDGKRQIIQQLLQEYDIKSAADMGKWNSGLHFWQLL